MLFPTTGIIGNSDSDNSSREPSGHDLTLSPEAGAAGTSLRREGGTVVHKNSIADILASLSMGVSGVSPGTQGNGFSSAALVPAVSNFGAFDAELLATGFPVQRVSVLPATVRRATASAPPPCSRQMATSFPSTANRRTWFPEIPTAAATSSYSTGRPTLRAHFRRQRRHRSK